MEQSGAKPGFEPGHGTAHRRSGHVQLGRGGPETLSLGDGQEDLQVDQSAFVHCPDFPH
jgi:hypothetical protein